MRSGLAKAIAKATNLTMLPSWVRHTFLPGLFKYLVRRGYKANSAVFACVSALAFGFPEPRLEVYQEMESGPEVDRKNRLLRDLLRKPNVSMSMVEFLQYCVTYAAIGGNCYIWKQRNSFGAVIGLWPLHDGVINVIPSTNTTTGLVEKYQIDIGEGDPKDIPVDDIIQWKWMVDPSEPWKGIGALRACWSEVQTDNEGTAYMYSLLKNDAVPQLVVTLVEGDELTPEKAKRLRKEWQQRYGGENKGGPAFLEAGMSVEKLSMNLQEMAFEALKNVPETRICAAFRVPPVIAGVNAGLKRSDYGDRHARRGFVEDTLASLWRQFAAELETGLMDEFRGNWYLEFDLSKVRALQEDESKRWARVTRAFQAGLIKRSEGKRHIGMPVDPEEDDVYYTDFYAQQDPNARANDGAQRDDPDEEDEEDTDSEKPKTKSRKQKKAQVDNHMAALRATREAVSQSFAAAIDLFFEELAEKVVERLKNQKSATVGEQKEDPPVEIEAEDLVLPEDWEELLALDKQFIVSLLKLSWNDWNEMLDVVIDFALSDPAVTRALAGAGERIKDIEETTLDAIRDLLQQASDEGWGIDQIVRGDPENGISGLQDVVTETYKGHAENIARYELGYAQNVASISRYEAADLEEIMVLDNGFENSNENCKWIDGQVRPLFWALSDHPDEGPSGIKNPLQHPRCVRAIAPYFGE
jgi:HK97 family phage portal protein